jgi:hypothetical protein
MAILPIYGQPISFSQIQEFVSSSYSVTSTSLRDLSQAAGKGVPDSMSEFEAIPIRIFARNRYTLFNFTTAITVYWKISASAGTGTWNTLSTQAITTSYENMGTIVLDPGIINTGNRLRIGINWGGAQSAQFGVGLNGTTWNTYCATLSPYNQTTYAEPIYLNIDVSGPNGQYVNCG